MPGSLAPPVARRRCLQRPQGVFVRRKPQTSFEMRESVIATQQQGPAVLLLASAHSVSLSPSLSSSSSRSPLTHYVLL